MIYLTDTLYRMKNSFLLPFKFTFVSIHNSMHNQLNHTFQKINFLQGTPNEFPVELVISFSQINFQSKKAFLSFLLAQTMDNFIGSDNILMYLSTRNKPSLTRRHQTRHMRLQSTH